MFTCHGMMIAPGTPALRAWSELIDYRHLEGDPDHELDSLWRANTAIVAQACSSLALISCFYPEIYGELPQKGTGVLVSTTEFHVVQDRSLAKLKAGMAPDDSPAHVLGVLVDVVLGRPTVRRESPMMHLPRVPWAKILTLDTDDTTQTAVWTRLAKTNFLAPAPISN